MDQLPVFTWTRIPNPSNLSLIMYIDRFVGKLNQSIGPQSPINQLITSTYSLIHFDVITDH